MAVSGEQAGSPDEAAQLFSVRGQVALVTGAGSGLGLAMAEVMAANGASVMLSDIDPARLESAEAAFKARGQDVAAAVTDVSDARAAQQLAERTVGTFGRIDVAFANAGINRGRSLAYPEGGIDVFPLEAWQQVMDTNLFGVFATLRAVAPVMKRQRSGSIVVTASTASLRAEPLMPYAYVTAKAAIVNLVRQAALDLNRYGIRVNAIAPGPFTTNIGAHRPPSAAYEAAWLPTIPMGRKAHPDEIKGIALLLASQASSFVTGSVWTIDGGATALTQGGIPDLSEDA
jgi:NAD(P)-dependent dehydrogenase (short-subunit alcohol dehydrogenase family)